LHLITKAHESCIIMTLRCTGGTLSPRTWALPGAGPGSFGLLRPRQFHWLEKWDAQHPRPARPRAISILNNNTLPGFLALLLSLQSWFFGLCWLATLLRIPIWECKPSAPDVHGRGARGNARGRAGETQPMKAFPAAKPMKLPPANS
jgi:hypothetical protein